MCWITGVFTSCAHGCSFISKIKIAMNSQYMVIFRIKTYFDKMIKDLGKLWNFPSQTWRRLVIVACRNYHNSEMTTGDILLWLEIMLFYGNTFNASVQVLAELVITLCKLGMFWEPWLGLLRDARQTKSSKICSTMFYNLRLDEIKVWS